MLLPLFQKHMSRCTTFPAVQADQSLCCPPEDALDTWQPKKGPANTGQTAQVHRLVQVFAGAHAVSQEMLCFCWYFYWQNNIRLYLYCINPGFLVTLSTYHTCPKIWNIPLYYLLMCLKYCCMYAKQCRPWLDAAFCGIWSGATLFANAYLSQYLGLLQWVD